MITVTLIAVLPIMGNDTLEGGSTIINPSREILSANNTIGPSENDEENNTWIDPSNSTNQLSGKDLTLISILVRILICGSCMTGGALLILLIIILVVVISRRSKKKTSGTVEEKNSPKVRPHVTKKQTSPDKGPSRNSHSSACKETSFKGPIICMGTVTIILVVLLLLTIFTGVIVFYAVDHEEKVRFIHIDSMGASSVDPMTLLNITGSGFDPEGSAISVAFTGQDGGITVLIPATYADEKRVEVVVPPFLNGSDRFLSGRTDVKVVQVSKDRVMTSNVLEGLEIRPMLEMGDTIRTGVYTHLFISACLDSLDEILTNATDPDLISRLWDHRTSLAELMLQLDELIAGDRGSIALNTIDYETTLMDTEGIIEMDRLLLNTVHRIVNVFPSNETRAGSFTRSDPVSGDELPESWREDYRQFREIPMKQYEIGSELVPAAGKFCYGLFNMVTGIVGGAPLAIGLAAQVAIAVGTSWLTQLATGEIPTPSGTLQTALETVSDDKMGVPVIALFKDQLGLLKKFDEGLEEAKRFRAGEPRGGVVLTDNKMSSTSDELRTLFKGEPGAPVKKLCILKDGSSIPFEDAIPQVLPGRIAYSGTFDGSATFTRTTNCPLCGVVASTFEYYVVMTGTFFAEVQEDGKMAGMLQFSGEWSATGVGGCPHIACIPSDGPINIDQSVSGTTSRFSVKQKGGEMFTGFSGSMDPESVTGYIEFQTIDGSFSVPYTLTVD